MSLRETTTSVMLATQPVYHQALIFRFIVFGVLKPERKCLKRPLANAAPSQQPGSYPATGK